MADKIIANGAAGDGDAAPGRQNPPDHAGGDWLADALFDSPFHYTVLLTPDGLLFNINRTALAEGGIPREAVLGTPFWELGWWGTSPQVQVRVREAIGRAAQGELVREDQSLCEDEDCLFVVELLLAPVRNNEGRIVHLVAEVRDISYRRQAELELRTSEERFRRAMHLSAVGMALVTPDGRLLEVNQALCRAVGYSVEELLAVTVESLSPPDDFEATLVNATALLAGEVDSYQMEKRYFHKDGGTIWGLLNASLVRDVTGAPLYFISQVQDITERRQAESALRESEGLFRAAMHLSAVGMALVAPDGRVLDTNRALCSIVGYSIEELLAGTVESISHPDDIETDLANARALLAGEIDTYQMEKRYIHKDGPTVWGLLNVSLVRDVAGAPLYFISQVQDITERRQAESALRESEERFRSAMRFTAIGMALVAMDGRFIEVNTALCDIVGYDEKELLAKDFQSITHPDDLEAERAYLRVMMRSEIDSYRLEKRYFHKNGSIVWIMLDASLVRSDDGTPRYSVAQMQDITKRKQAEEALRLSEERFRTVIGLSSVAMTLVAPDGRMRVMNHAFCRILGYTKAELRELDFQTTTFAEDITTELAYVQAMLRREINTYQLEKRLVRKDGRIIWVLCNVSMVSDSDGATLYFVSQIEEIADRKMAEGQN